MYRRETTVVCTACTATECEKNCSPPDIEDLVDAMLLDRRMQMNIDQTKITSNVIIFLCVARCFMINLLPSAADLTPVSCGFNSFLEAGCFD